MRNNDEFKKFFEYRDELKYRYGQEEFLFFTLGINLQEKSKVYYSYIYIPVESITSEVIKIENKEMQDLMSTDILDEIDHILNEKNFSSNGNGRVKKTSLIDYLNSNLDEYMNNINDTIGMIDKSYAYKVEQ